MKLSNLPVGVNWQGNIKGDEGPAGPAGSWDRLEVVTVPNEAGASGALIGTPANRGVRLAVPEGRRGLSGFNGTDGRDGRDGAEIAPTNEAVASWLNYAGDPVNVAAMRETQRVTSRQVPSGRLEFAVVPGESIIPLDIGSDGWVYGASRVPGDNTIIRSADGFATRESGPKFSDLGDGRIVRTVTRTAEGYYAVLSGSTWGSDFSTVWFSENWASGWTKVHEMRHVLQISISRPVPTDEGTVILLGEYGNGDVRRVFLSRNGGRTWSQIYTHTRKPGVTETNNHIHHAMFDPDMGRIWVSAGDGLNSYMGYSADWGATWTPVPAKLPLIDNPGATYRQPTILTPTSSRIISTPDGGVGRTGVWEMDKLTGDARVSYEVADTPPFRSYPLHPWVQRGDVVYILYPPIPSVGFEDHIYIAATGDGGQSWHTIYSQYAPKWEWQFIEGIVGPDKDGRIFMYGEQDGTPRLHVGWSVGWQPEAAAASTFESRAVERAALAAAGLSDARAGRGEWCFGDDFQRADAPSLGVAWAHLGAAVGRWTIEGGRARPAVSGQNARVFAPLDTSDAHVTVELPEVAINATEFWVLIRGRDENNYYRWGRLNATTLALQKIAGGVATTLWSTNQRDLTKPGSLGVRAQGDYLTVYLNGAALERVTDGAIKGTLTGLQAFSHDRLVGSIRARRVGPSPWAGAWRVVDSFVRAGVTGSPGSSETGQTWETPAGRGAWQVIAGRIRPVADTNSIAAVSSGTSSHITTVSLEQPLGQFEFWLLSDILSAGDMYRFGRLNQTTLALQKIVGGTLTTLWSKSGYDLSKPSRLSMGRSGDRIHVFLNGGRIHSGTDSSLSGSMVGVQAFSSQVGVTSVSVRDYAPA